MATIKMQYATEATLTTTDLATCADGASKTSNVIDNSSSLYLGMDFIFTLTGTATTSVDTVDVYLVGSNDNTAFGTSSTEEGEANLLFIGSVSLNTSTAASKLIHVEQLPKYFKLKFINNSGGALTAETVKYSGTSLTNA